MANYYHSESMRTKLVDEMVEAAQGTSKTAAAQRTAIQTLVDWYRSGAQGEEPELTGLSWKTECAISSDLLTIFKQDVPEGSYPHYEREYVNARRKAVIQAARARSAKARQTGLDTLRSLLP